MGGNAPPQHYGGGVKVYAQSRTKLQEEGEAAGEGESGFKGRQQNVMKVREGVKMWEESGRSKIERRAGMDEQPAGPLITDS